MKVREPEKRSTMQLTAFFNIRHNVDLTHTSRLSQYFAPQFIDTKASNKFEMT